MPSERTPLTGSVDPGPPYVFVTNPNRMYRKQIREFQCCVCATILLIVLTALVASITYSVDNDDIDVPTNNTNSSVVVASNLTLHSLLGMSWPLQGAKDQIEGIWKGPSLTSEQMQDAIAWSRQAIDRTINETTDGPHLPVDSPSYRHQQSIRTSAMAVKLASIGLLGETITKHVSKDISVKGSIGKGPAFTSCDEDSVAESMACVSSPYRTYDGACNNQKHKDWGVGMHAFRRELEPNYADGISAPRASMDGTELPSAREVSVTIHRPVYRDDPKFTVMLAVWGQFMDHDVTATALTKGKNGGSITCCGVPKKTQHPACYPVQLKPGDDYYHKYNMTCMEFIRSSPAPRCTLGPREQLNQVSSYLDGSVVYGNTESLANRLRTFEKGELKMYHTPDDRELLPISTDPQDGCNEKEQNAHGRYCFMTGDARANENTHLTSMHLLLARQHNTLARQLSATNPDWDDETVYQESRRILSAQMQHITYNEFLPVLLGPALMTKLNLTPQSSGHWDGYNPDIDPTISNNFATSAFRFAHTLIPGLMKVLANDTSSVEYVELHKMLFNPYEIYAQGGLDKTLNGAMTTNVERADNYFTTQLTQHLFEQVGSKVPYGLDLVSLNIQRGRDHGLPSYPKWRKYCGLSEPKSFDDLKDHVDEESLQLLAKVYKSVDDVDMYTGGLSEKPIEGGMLGPTMTCLIANQFVRMKSGDRYWYETSEQPQAFTQAQLNEIRKTSLAGIICQNSDHVEYAQKKVMQLVNEDNKRVACSEISQPDLTLWMENKKQTLKFSYPVLPSNVTKFGAKTMSGNVALSDGQQLWNGVLPVEIPLSSFGEMDTKGRYNVVWSGTVEATAANNVQVKGTFSFPSFRNGSFKFDLSLFWNNTNAVSFSASGTYDTQIIFAEREKSSYLLSSQLLKASTNTSKIILYGQYVKNNTAFVWSGNSTAILLNEFRIKVISHFENQNVPSVSAESLIHERPLQAPSAESLIKENAAFGVSNGHLSLNNSMVWSGITPVDVPNKYPVPPFKSSSFAYFAKLNGIVSENKYAGNFFIPNVENGVKSVTTGEFSLQLVELNSQKVDVFRSNVNYNAKILFRQSDGRSVVDWAREPYDLNTYEVDEDSSSWNWFLMSSKKDSENNIAIVLQGSYSSDNASFSWSGNFVLYSHGGAVLGLGALGSSKDKRSTDNDKAKAKDDDKANKGLVYGGHVSYATITGGFDSAPAQVLQSGSFPQMMYIGDVFVGVPAWERSLPLTWKGSLENGVLTGNYSIQVKDHLLEGTFTANVVPTFKPFPADLVNPNTAYSTAMTLKQYNSESSVSLFLTLPTKATTTSLQLVGTFSPDSESFYFPGDFTFTVGASPKPEPEITLGAALEASKDKAGKNDKKDKAKDGKKDKDKKKPAKGETIGVMVKTAVITSGRNGSEPETVYNGAPPMMSYIGDMFKGMPPWQRAINVLWTAEIAGNSIRGNYSAVVQGQLYSGSFAGDLAPMWKPKLDLSILKSNTYYSTNLLFTQWGKSSGITFTQPSEPVDASLMKLFSSAQQLTLDAIDSSVIIVGTFSPDGTSFYWPGSLRFIKTPPPAPSDDPLPDVIPSSTSQPEVTTSVPINPSSEQPIDDSESLQLRLVSSLLGKSKPKRKDSDDVIPNWFKGQLVVKVLGGFVSAYLEDRPTETWWYEFLPVDLPSNPFWTPSSDAVGPKDNNTVFSHGIIWSASFIGESNIQGTFSLPQYIRSDGDLYNVQWYNGNFNFKFNPLWNSLLDQFVEPNVKYYSPLHFQSTTNPWLESKPSQDVINNAKPAPIILLGNQTPEKFSWSGGAVIVFK